MARHIAEHLNSHECSTYLEPFMGSCWVTAKVKHKTRLAGDAHNEIVCLYHRVVNEGWEPPEHISEDEYKSMRAQRFQEERDYSPEMMAFVGFGCAYGGAYFRMYAGESYAGRSKRSILKKSKHLEGVQFFTADYKDLNPSGCLVYCDPPYDGKYSYRISGRRGNGEFNTDEFWGVMDQWSENNVVYISELSAPEGYECVMDVAVTSCIRSKDGCTKRHEKLFCKNKDLKLPTLDSLGATNASKRHSDKVDWKQTAASSAHHQILSGENQNLS